MKPTLVIKGILVIIFIPLLIISCSKKQENMNDFNSQRIIFLHHSTGQVILNGSRSIKTRIYNRLGFKVGIQKMLAKYNRKKHTNHSFSEQVFPKSNPYGWKNYPFDYYNIWVKNSGDQPFLEEPTLEMLTKQYDIIVFKHCYPVSNMESDSVANIDSEKKTIDNYKLQYIALRNKLLQFPQTKFLLWTGAALVEKATNEAEALMAREFFKWVKEEWDQPGDNIYIWDFRQLETEGGLYLKPEYAVSDVDSHPSKIFAAKAQPLFFDRIVQVIEEKVDIKN